MTPGAPEDLDAVRASYDAVADNYVQSRATLPAAATVRRRRSFPSSVSSREVDVVLLDRLAPRPTEEAQLVKVLDLYRRADRVPVVGRGVFSLAFALKAPYFLTIAPTLVELRPNHAVVRVRKWWGVHNHIGTVHVIAVANGLEMAMGALAESTIPSHLRWIPKGMELEYLAMASSTLLASADTDPADWEQPGEVPVRVQATRQDGTVVVRGVIRLHLSLRV